VRPRRGGRCCGGEPGGLARREMVLTGAFFVDGASGESEDANQAGRPGDRLTGRGNFADRRPVRLTGAEIG
jgi:hypothetical protein